MEDKSTQPDEEWPVDLEGLSQRYWYLCEHIREWDTMSSHSKLLVTKVMQEIYERTNNQKLKRIISTRASSLREIEDDDIGF